VWVAVTLRSNSNVVFQCAYHVVWCPKYRRRVLGGRIEERLKELIREVVDEKGAWLVEMEVMPDHVHLLVEVDPQYGIHRLVKAIKGRSSRVLREEFPHLKSRLPTLWTNSYFVATVGGAPLAAEKRYVAQQKGRSMLTGRRYLLAFTPEQEEFAERIGDVCRVVWNTALEQRRAYRRCGAFIGYVEQARQVAEAKRDFPWLAEGPSHTLQQTLRDLDRACARHGTFKVRWRSKRKNAPTFRFPDANQITVERVSRRWGRVKLPKLGWTRFRWTRPLGGQLRNATV